MSFADTLPDNVRRKGQRYAITSALFGCISEWVNDSNAIIILFLVMLGGSEAFSLFSSSFSALASVLLGMPCALLISRIGLRRSYTSATFFGMVMFLLMASAPMFGPRAKYVVMIGALCYNLSRPLYSNSWYPMCGNVLRSDERGKFFSTMRFSYMILNTCLLYLAGRFMGDEPQLWKFQVIILFAAVMAFGRVFCMNKMPIDKSEEKEAGNFIRSLCSLFNEHGVLGYAFYLFAAYTASIGLLPLCIIYMKKGLAFGADTIMTVTSCRLCGMIIGFVTVRFATRLFSVRRYQVLTHILLVLVSFFVLFVRPDGAHSAILMGILFFSSGLAYAHLMCLSSMRTIELAPQNNRVVAMSFCLVMQSIGSVISTLGATLLLASGALAPKWTVFGVDFSHYHFMFIIYFLLCVFSMLFLILVPGQKKES